MDSYISNEFRVSAKRAKIDVEEKPTELYPVDFLDGYTVVSPNKLSVKYTGPGREAGIAQAYLHAPRNCCAYYFEIHVDSAGDRGDIAFGFSTLYLKGEECKVKSCGYIGNGGLIYRQDGQDRTVVTATETYTTGDTVGCGIDHLFQEFFFTKNGALVGTIPRDFKGLLYPTIALQSQNEEVTVNFGTEPESFVFDFTKHKASLRNKQTMELDKISIPQSLPYMLVKDYLLHCGYEDTYHAFDLAIENAVPPIDMAKYGGFYEFALHHRKQIRELIMKGEIDDAFAEVKDNYPDIVEELDGSEVSFFLACQKIVELVKNGSREEAVTYGEAKLKDFRDSTLLNDILNDYKSLIECENPEEAGVEYLLGDMQRELVADAVNAGILSTYQSNIQLYSRLEILLRQLGAVSDLYANTRENESIFSLQQLLNNNNNNNS